jgi:predicted house-cleaning noncanonical NTP pyrophosphatase (MazG superfamily)
MLASETRSCKTRRMEIFTDAEALKIHWAFDESFDRLWKAKHYSPAHEPKLTPELVAEWWETWNREWLKDVTNEAELIAKMRGATSEEVEEARQRGGAIRARSILKFLKEKSLV